MLHVAITPEVEGILADMAARTGSTSEEIARRALLAYLEDLEDYAAAVAAWKAHDPALTVSAEDFLREFDVAA